MIFSHGFLNNNVNRIFLNVQNNVARTIIYLLIRESCIGKIIQFCRRNLEVTRRKERERRRKKRERTTLDTKNETKQNRETQQSDGTKTQNANGSLYLSLFPLLVFDMALFHIGYSIYFTVSINIDRSYVQKMLNASRVATRA